jgi:hypothetical protein
LNAGVIGAMRRAPERGAVLLLLLFALAAPRLVGADTDAADGTFVRSFVLASPHLAPPALVSSFPNSTGSSELGSVPPRCLAAAPIVRWFELHEFGFCRL